MPSITGRACAEHYKQSYSQFLDAHNTYLVAATVLAESDKGFFAEDGSHVGLRVFSSYFGDRPEFGDPEAPQKAAAEMVKGLCRLAAREFAPAGLAALDIDEDHYVEQYASRRDFDPRGFDPLQFWGVLESEYGGEKGVEEGLSKAAKALISSFGLRYRPQIKRKPGHVPLDLNVYVETSFAHGGKELGYRSAESFNETLDALRCFVSWCNLAGEYFDQHARGTGPGVYHRRVESRERFLLIEGELELITYYTRFEFRFSHSLAAQLQAFIGQYGDLVEREAA